MNPLFQSFGTTIFEEMSQLARAHGAVNLGQGFPDGEGPEPVRRRAAEALLAGPSQYPPMMGLPALREAVAAYHAERYGQALDPRTDVLVTAGGTEGLAAAIFALVAPGEEAVVFAPAFDVYAPLVRLAGGRLKVVALRPPDFGLTAEALAAITPATRLVVFNSPQNPAARVYGADELERLAAACRRSGARVLCDEVWEHTVFDAHRHLPLARLSGMAERCLKVGSGGKLMGMTGWKVGWVCGPADLVQAAARAHQFICFTVAPATQAALAAGVSDAALLEELRLRHQRSRDRLAAGLAAEGFRTLACEGTWFLNVDLPASGFALDDATFCRRAVAEAGVAAIPVSAFYPAAEVASIVRLCHAKADDTLDLAVDRLARARRILA